MEYRIVAVERGGEWRAHAERVDTGDRFGIECTGASQGDAIRRLTAWLDWQRAHVAALEALQDAERAYHRVVAANAFAGAGDRQTRERLESLAALDRARAQLDAVRAKRPETS
ncbi:MAG: hypothetical protein HY047_08530 [Acidobacteria bacterium]|nr:hypothetical protein [Acidobacteriota bacterium]